MIKNIVIGLLSFVTLAMTLYAFIKASDAERAKKEAKEQRVIAEEYFEIAQKQEESTIKEAAEARRQKNLVDELRIQLANCH